MEDLFELLKHLKPRSYYFLCAACALLCWQSVFDGEEAACGWVHAAFWLNIQWKYFRFSLVRWVRGT